MGRICCCCLYRDTPPPTFSNDLFTDISSEKQAEEYAKLKGVCAAHALAGTTPPGVATIEIACEALKLAEWLTPELQKKLKK